jgi:microcystin-dependent protein
MSSPYIGEIRMFGGNFAPNGWAMCQGQLLPISEYDALFNLIGTTYGGDGQETFALPNLQGRAPMHVGNGHVIGELGGVETVTLTAQQMPAHSHPQAASLDAGQGQNGTNSVPAVSVANVYHTPAANAALAPTAVLTAGGSQPHDNMQPYLVVNFIIALFGVYPPSN